MKRQSRQLLLLASLSVPALAQSQEEVDSSPVADAESQFLFINMLEFLGEFETEAGDWISPDILANEVFSDLDAPGNDSQEAGSRQRVLSATAEDEP